MSHLPTLGESPPFRHLPTSVLAHLDGAGSDLLSRGWVSTADAQIAVIHRGPRLEVVSTRSNERIAAWTFGTDSAGRHSSRRRDSPEVGQTFEITSCVELFGPSNTGINTIGTVPKSSSGTSTPIELGQQQHHPLQRRLLVVGLASGLICVFDIRSSRIIRAIQMPHRITALAILGNGGSGYGSAVVGGGNDIGLAGLGLQLRNNLLAEELLFFRGIVAVGTQEGHIYLLDIALDDAEDSRAAGYAPTFLESDEANSAEPYFIDIGSSQNINESGKPSLANTRAAALRRGEHLCIELNESAYTKGKNVFCHTSNSTGKTSHFDEANVVVTALKYVPQLASLLAGFNFGSWQMFNLMQFSNSSIATSASYSSSYDKDNSLPVTAFSFQEPENDPRNFCYIWSVKCDNDWDTEVERISHLESKSTITLYALAYENRDDGGDQYGVLYNGLTQCNKAFDHTLQSESQFMQDVVGSVCIANYTLEPGLARNISGSGATIGLDISELDNSLCNLGISAFLWQCYTKNGNGERVSRHYLGIFDLNAWYQEHMPSYVQLEEGVQCPYFSFCSLEDVLISSNMEANASELQEYQGSSNTLTNNLIHVCIDMSTISKYNSLSKVEQHFYPSSLAFELICLMNNGFVYASHLGLQRKVLLELQTRGRSNLVEPDHLFQLCTIAGLVSNDTVASISKQNTNVEQRSALLTVALEHHLVNFLIGCVTQWSDGKYSYAGCTLKFLLEWAWSSVSNMKQHVIDKQTIQLFDWSCAEVNESTRRSLVQSSQQLKHLSIVIGELMKVSSSGVYFQTDYEYTKELHLKYSVTQLINTYLEVILWFVNAGLLPEIPPSIDLNSDNPYPADLLASKYDSRREEMRSKLREWDYFNKDTHCLIIDGLCNEMGPEMASNFERESEKRREYPPPNFRSLLLTYLIHKDREFTDGSVDMLNRHRIIQYLFHDMTNTLGDKWNDLIHTLIKFPAAFSVPPSLIKLTHAFWLLDNGDFEEAMVMLLDPLVLGNDISLWQHRAIVISFLVQDQAKLALKYCKIRQPPQKDMVDVQLQVAVLLANGMVHEAFQFQRQKGRNSELERIQLLSYFFSKAEALGKLDTILQLPLMISEEAALERYLKEGIEAHTKLRQEVLLMYYLQRSRFSEALNLNEHLERQANLGTKGMSDNTRKAIMERYAHRLPALKSKISTKENIDKIKSRSILPVKTYHVSITSKSSMMPTFNSETVRQVMENKSIAHKKSQQSSVIPSTPFRPKESRKEIGLFRNHHSQHKQSTLCLKRKFSEVSTSVYPTDEVNGANKSICEGRYQFASPRNSKRPRLSSGYSLSSTDTKFASTMKVLSTPTIKRKTFTTPLRKNQVETPQAIDRHKVGDDSTYKSSILKTAKFTDNRRMQLYEPETNQNSSNLSKPDILLEVTTKTGSSPLDSTDEKQFSGKRSFVQTKFEESKPLIKTLCFASNGDIHSEDEIPKTQDEHKDIDRDSSKSVNMIEISDDHSENDEDASSDHDKAPTENIHDESEKERVDSNMNSSLEIQELDQDSDYLSSNNELTDESVISSEPDECPEETQISLDNEAESTSIKEHEDFNLAGEEEYVETIEPESETNMSVDNYLESDGADERDEPCLEYSENEDVFDAENEKINTSNVSSNYSEDDKSYPYSAGIDSDPESLVTEYQVSDKEYCTSETSESSSNVCKNISKNESDKEFIDFDTKIIEEIKLTRSENMLAPTDKSYLYKDENEGIPLHRKENVIELEKCLMNKKLDSSDVYKIVEEVYLSVVSKPDQCISIDDKIIHEDTIENAVKIDNFHSNQLIDQNMSETNEFYVYEPLVIYPSKIDANNETTKATATDSNTEQILDNIDINEQDHKKGTILTDTKTLPPPDTDISVYCPSSASKSAEILYAKEKSENEPKSYHEQISEKSIDETISLTPVNTDISVYCPSLTNKNAEVLDSNEKNERARAIAKDIIRNWQNDEKKYNSYQDQSNETYIDETVALPPDYADISVYCPSSTNKNTDLLNSNEKNERARSIAKDIIENWQNDEKKYNSCQDPNNETSIDETIAFTPEYADISVYCPSSTNENNEAFYTEKRQERARAIAKDILENCQYNESKYSSCVDQNHEAIIDETIALAPEYADISVYCPSSTNEDNDPFNLDKRQERARATAKNILESYQINENKYKKSEMVRNAHLHQQSTISILEPSSSASIHTDISLYDPASSDTKSEIYDTDEKPESHRLASKNILENWPTNENTEEIEYPRNYNLSRKNEENFDNVDTSYPLHTNISVHCPSLKDENIDITTMYDYVRAIARNDEGTLDSENENETSVDETEASMLLHPEDSKPNKSIFDEVGNTDSSEVSVLCPPKNEISDALPSNNRNVVHALLMKIVNDCKIDTSLTVNDTTQQTTIVNEAKNLVKSDLIESCLQSVYQGSIPSLEANAIGIAKQTQENSTSDIDFNHESIAKGIDVSENKTIQKSNFDVHESTSSMSRNAIKDILTETIFDRLTKFQSGGSTEATCIAAYQARDLMTKVLDEIFTKAVPEYGSSEMNCLSQEKGHYIGVRSRSVSPTSHSEDDRVHTPLRRSRRLSERSTTPSREVSEEPIEPEEKLLRSRKVTTPKKAGRASPNPKTPRRSRRMSGGTQNEGASVTILETLVEDDEERNDITNDVDMTVKVDDVLESNVPVTISPKSARITRSKRKIPEELVNETGEPLPSKSDKTDTTSQDTPLRVTRSSSKSSAASSPVKKIGSTKGTRLKSSKPPLKLIKDPFSPQITEEQKEELNKRKEANKMVPRKKYSAVRKTKSKRI